MGGFIIGIGIALLILVILKLGSYFRNKRKKYIDSSNSVINLNENSADDDEAEKGE